MSSSFVWQLSEVWTVVNDKAPYRPAPEIAGNSLVLPDEDDHVSADKDGGDGGGCDDDGDGDAGIVVVSVGGCASSACTSNVTPIALITTCEDNRYLKNSYVDQQIAVDGIWYKTRALMPLKYPNGPPSL